MKILVLSVLSILMGQVSFACMGIGESQIEVLRNKDQKIILINKSEFRNDSRNARLIKNIILKAKPGLKSVKMHYINSSNQQNDKTVSMSAEDNQLLKEVRLDRFLSRGDSLRIEALYTTPKTNTVVRILKTVKIDPQAPLTRGGCAAKLIIE